MDPEAVHAAVLCYRGVEWPMDFRSSQAVEDFLCLKRDCRLDPHLLSVNISLVTWGNTQICMSNRLWGLKTVYIKARLGA